jgi:hypothetical protein
LADLDSLHAGEERWPTNQVRVEYRARPLVGPTNRIKKNINSVLDVGPKLCS